MRIVGDCSLIARNLRLLNRPRIPGGIQAAVSYSAASFGTGLSPTSDLGAAQMCGGDAVDVFLHGQLDERGVFRWVANDAEWVFIARDAGELLEQHPAR